MLFASHIGLKRLAQLCRRLGTALEAGIDVRRSWDREAQWGPAQHRTQIQRISQAINQGQSIPAAVRQTDSYFPEFFREMVELGDRTGKLDRVLLRLAEHYEHMLSLRRIFLLGIAWPAIQLAMAIGIIGLLIAALGWVSRTTGQKVDLLGFGLVGGSGLIRYFLLLTVLAACGYGIYLLLTRGPVAEVLQRVLMHIPGIGHSLKVIALARMAWTLGLALDSGADARNSLRLALSNTLNAHYTQHTEALDRAIRSGHEMHQALRETAAFPSDFLDSVQVGEESGRLSESLLKLAEQYRDQAKAATTGLTIAATMVVWGFVATILIVLIFRLFGAYLGILDEAVRGI